MPSWLLSHGIQTPPRKLSGKPPKVPKPAGKSIITSPSSLFSKAYIKVSLTVCSLWKASKAIWLLSKHVTLNVSAILSWWVFDIPTFAGRKVINFLKLLYLFADGSTKKRMVDQASSPSEPETATETISDSLILTDFDKTLTNCDAGEPQTRLNITIVSILKLTAREHLLAWQASVGSVSFSSNVNLLYMTCKARQDPFAASMKLYVTTRGLQMSNVSNIQPSIYPWFWKICRGEARGWISSRARPNACLNSAASKFCATHQCCNEWGGEARSGYKQDRSYTQTDGSWDSSLFKAAVTLGVRAWHWCPHCIRLQYNLHWRNAERWMFTHMWAGLSSQISSYLEILAKKSCNLHHYFPSVLEMRMLPSGRSDTKWIYVCHKCDRLTVGTIVLRHVLNKQGRQFLINSFSVGAGVQNLIKSVITNKAESQDTVKSEGAKDLAILGAVKNASGQKPESAARVVITPRHDIDKEGLHRCPICPSNLCKVGCFTNSTFPSQRPGSWRMIVWLWYKRSPAACMTRPCFSSISLNGKLQMLTHSELEFGACVSCYALVTVPKLFWCFSQQYTRDWRW